MMNRNKFYTAFAGEVWAMQEHRLRSLINAEFDFGPDYTYEPVGYDVVNGVAVVQMIGAVSKYPDIWMQVLGGASTLDVATALQRADNDPTVNSIVLVIDSPGGTVAGTADLADVFGNLEKPTTAFCSDLCASAAYWVASQADTIVVNPTGAVGSIGVYVTVADTSRMYEDAGIKVQLVKAGENKGLGTDGVEITSADIQVIQKEVDAIYDLFVAAVAEGRGLDKADVKALANGQTYIASDAVDLGLADEIGTLENTINIMGKNMAKKIAVKTLDKGVENSTDIRETETPVVVEVETVAKADHDKIVAALAAAESKVESVRSDSFKAGQKAEQDRLAELAELADNNASFVLEQFRAGLTAASATKAYVQLVKADAARAVAEAAGVKAEQSRSLDASNGVSRLALAPTGAGPTGDPETDWDNNVNNCQSKFPAGKKAYVAFTNREARIAKKGK